MGNIITKKIKNIILNRSSTAKDDHEGHQAVTHAMITQSWFLKQGKVPVSLVIKDTEVRSCSNKAALLMAPRTIY
jgi:hypothetical protein